MNKKALVIAIMAVGLGVGASAFAQDNNYRQDRGDRTERTDRGDRDGRQARDGRDDRRHDSDRREHRSDGRDGRWDGRSDHRPHYGHGYSQNHGYGQNHGYRQHHGYYNGPRHNYRRGGYVSHEYRGGSRYVVNDWRRYRLSAPPRGYQWVQANNDYLLVAVATGLIAQVLLH